MFFKIYTTIYIDYNNQDDQLEVSFIYEIDDEELFAEAKYKHIKLMKERGDVVKGMNINIPHYKDNKSFELNCVDIYIKYNNIELCSSSDCDDFSELDNLSELDDSFNDEIINDIISEIKNVELLYEYDTHYDCDCKTQKVCGCGCDELHDGW